MWYLFDPISGEKKEVSTDLAEGITGISRRSLSCMKSRNAKIRTLNAYLIDDTFSKKDLLELMNKEKIKNEIWKYVKGYGKKYKVSNYGRIMRKRKNKDEYIFIIPFDYQNKALVNLMYNNHRANFILSTIVGKTFLSVKKSERVCHIDGNYFNNRLENLKVLSLTEANSRAGKVGRSVPIVKLDPKTLEELEEYENIKQAAQHNYIDGSSISRCLRGIQKIAGGYAWRLNIYDYIGDEKID